MRLNQFDAVLRQFPLLMAATVLVLPGAVHAQEPEDPEPEHQFEEPPDSELLDEGTADADADGDEVPTDPADDFGDDVTMADAEDLEDWWDDEPFDPSDDAIPTDKELDPEGLGFEVLEFEDDGDGVEDVPVESADGIHDSRAMPIIRLRTVSSPRPPGAGQPPRPAQPASGGGEDTPHAAHRQADARRAAWATCSRT